MLLLALQRFGFRKLEAFVATMLVVIAGCFAYELGWRGPIGAPSRAGSADRADRHQPGDALYRDRHPGRYGDAAQSLPPSSVVQTRAIERDDKQGAIRFATIDTVIALGFALLINAAILILAAATFHVAGRTDVADIEDAHRLLSPMLGAGAASVVFALALLASGQNSTITGTLAGQIVMKVPRDLAARVAPADRDLGDRDRPAALVIGLVGEGATTICSCSVRSSSACNCRSR